jgi:hypothetical protein
VKDAQEIKNDFFNMVSNATAGGGSKKGKKQRNRNKGQNEDVDADEIQINIETISFFAHLQVKAPLKKDDCVATVAELEKKLADYEERGNKELLEFEEEDDEEKPHRNRREDDNEDNEGKKRHPKEQQPKKGKAQPLKYNPDQNEWPGMN